MEAYTDAEAAYQKAYHVLPNRLYPLYQLMCLYEQTDERQKMWQMAQQVIEFNVKMESPATKKMQEDLNDIRFHVIDCFNKVQIL